MGLLSSDKNDSKVQETERVAADAAAAIADEKAKTGKKRAQSYWAVSWNIFKKNKLGMFCLIVVALLCLVAIFAPVLLPPYRRPALRRHRRRPIPCRSLRRIE